MKLPGKIVNWIWNIIQILLAFQLNAFFLLSDPLVDGKEVIWMGFYPVQVEGEAFGFWIFHFELLTIVGAFALLYVVIGFLQAAYVPQSEKWARGANWVASLVVAVPLVWTWVRLVTDPHYQITLFQHQILYMITLAVVLDVLMDLLLPLIGKVAKKVVDATTPPP